LKKLNENLKAANESLQTEIAERQQTEEALRESEERYHILAENFPNGVVLLFDKNLRFTLAEGAGLAAVGLSKERMQGNTIWEVFSPEDCAVIEPHYRAALAGTAAHFEMPYTDRVFLVHTLPIQNERGEIFAGMVMTQDITERKEAERLKDEFVSTVSHELRTPLTSLRGFAELMLKRDFPPEKQREFLTIIHSEAIRLTNLINDFLDLQRIESGRQVYHFDSVEMTPVLHEGVTLFAHENGKHILRLAVPDSLPPVRADADRIRQVLANLLSNAVKFSPQGGEVTVGARQEGTNVVIWVADQGVGISSEALPRLFSRFFRVDNTATRSVGGTGLGLALVKEIVEAHEGKVWVESAPGKGSTFFFTLPLAEQAARIQAIPRPVDAIGTTDILVVEDNQAYARLLQEHFASAGMTVAVTDKAEEALEWIQRSAPRLVLTDIHLAGRLDGWDLLVALKDDQVLRSIPVLIIAASEEANVRGLALAGADYLLKPVSPDWLLHAIRQCLPTLPGKCVLVVDDDAAFCRQVGAWLASEGVVVEEGANGREALAHMARRIPDLLLLDLLMPEMDGFEVLRQLRVDRRTVNLPVLVVTGKDLLAEEKIYLKQKLATLVSKKEASLDYFARVVGQILTKN
jgi:PAS domain S-box-containing protein